MKRKLSFLIAAIMVLSLLPAMSVSAATSNGIAVGGGTVASDYDWSDGRSDLVPFLRLTKTDDYTVSSWVAPSGYSTAGYTFTLTLSNAEWVLGELDFAPTGSAWTGVNTTFAGNPVGGVMSFRGAQAAGTAQTDAVTAGEVVNGAVSQSMVNYDLQVLSPQYALVTIPQVAAAAGLGNNSLAMNNQNTEMLIPLAVKLTGEGPARVEMGEVTGVAGISAGGYTFANGTSGATSTTLQGTKKTFSTAVTLDTIVVKETIPGTLSMGTVPNARNATGKVLKFTAPAGFEWDFTGAVPAIAGSSARATVGFGNETLGPGVFLRDGDDETTCYIDLGWFTCGDSTSAPGSIVVSGLVIKRSDVASQTPVGDVKVRVSVSDGTQEYVTVAEYVARGVTMTVADKELPQIISGAWRSDAQASAAECLEVTIKESSPYAWNRNAPTVFTLSDGAKFRAVEVTSATNLGGDIARGSIFFAAGSAATGNPTGSGAAAGPKVRLTDTKIIIDNITGAVANRQIEFKFKVWVTVKPHVTGDIVLMTHEDTEAFGGELSGVVGKAIDPFEITMNTNDIHLGYMNIPLGDIILKENQAGALMRTTTQNHTEFYDNTLTAGNYHYLFDIGGYRAYYNNVGFFKGAGTYERLAGDIIIDKTDVNNGNLRLHVKRASTTASEIKFTGMTMDADRTIPEGKLSLQVGGAATANRRNNGATDRAGCFDVDWFEYPGYVNVITAAPDKDTKYTTEVEVTIGSTTIVANGKETEMDVAPFIEDGYTMVPVRAVVTALGLEDNQVNWNANTKTVTIMDTGRGRISQFTAGSNEVVVSGMAVPFEGPSCMIKDSRTFLPFRALGEIVLACPVDWDPDTRTAYFNKGGTTATTPAAAPAEDAAATPAP